MDIFTIGYTKKSAKTFFELIDSNNINLLVDIRLYNSTQLAGFSKGQDLKYFLKRLCSCDYIYAPQFAPTSSLFNNYKKGYIDWNGYEKIYNDLLNTRDELDFFEAFSKKRICLLCAEDTPEHCHRRLLAEKISEKYENMHITHL